MPEKHNHAQCSVNIHTFRRSPIAAPNTCVKYESVCSEQALCSLLWVFFCSACRQSAEDSWSSCSDNVTGMREKHGTFGRPPDRWLLHAPLLFEPVLLMIVPNYVSLVFLLFTIQMLLKANCLPLCAVNPGLLSTAQLDDCVLSSWVKCCLIALQAACCFPGRS